MYCATSLQSIYTGNVPYSFFYGCKINAEKLVIIIIKKNTTMKNNINNKKKEMLTKSNNNSEKDHKINE